MPEAVAKVTTNCLRVAAAQFATGRNVGDNLTNCLDMIDKAAADGADLLVLPEFCNHISVYDSAEECREVAVRIGGKWLEALTQHIAKHQLHVALAVTVLRDDERVTVTNLLINQLGQIIASADKSMLMGNERTYLSPSKHPRSVAQSKFGPLGLYACMDGVTFEIPRLLAVQGARLLLNSLNSFARDEAALHIPVRAAENGVFVVAANKVGALLPPHRLADFSDALGVDADMLNGAGESQIVAPDGEVLAMAPAKDEALITCDIDLSNTQPERLANRRPSLYQPLAQPNNASPQSTIEPEMSVACVPAAQTKPELIEEAITANATLVVLPELTMPPPTIPAECWVVTSTLQTTVDGGVSHIGQVWTTKGVMHQQPQLHKTSRYPQVTELGKAVTLCETPFGNLAVFVGDDHLYPEVVRLAAISGAHLAVFCWQPSSDWETKLALPQRCAENRLSVVACAPTGLGSAVVCDPPADSLWNKSRSSPHDGTINFPQITEADQTQELLLANLHPSWARNREVSKDTDLVAGRPWLECGALTVEL